MTDWADDPDMPDDETLRTFDALGPHPTTGPPMAAFTCEHMTAQGPFLTMLCYAGCQMRRVMWTAAITPGPKPIIRYVP